VGSVSAERADPASQTPIALPLLSFIH
jgi:hypothetical protein